MKKNHNRNQKPNHQAREREREFNEMSSRLMNEFREKKNSNHSNERGEKKFNNKKYENKHEETKNSEQGEEFTGPVSHTDDFIKTVLSVVEKCESMVDKNDCGIKVYEGRKKEESGSVFVKVTIENLTSEESQSETLMFYFTEDHSINPKKKNFVRNYMEHILIINQKTGNILFNKFGHLITDKATAYIEKMITKTVEVIVGKPVMETAVESE